MAKNQLGKKINEMIRHWTLAHDKRLLEQDVKDLLNQLIKTFKSKFEHSLHSNLTRLQKRIPFQYGYETERIEVNVPMVYIPDWPITTASGKKIYVEAKGYFRPLSKQKLQAVKKQYPNMDIRLVFYRANKKDIRWCEKWGFRYAIGKIPEDWLK